MSRPRKQSYLAGFLACLAAAAIAEMALGHLAAGSATPEALQGLGGLFTGLTLLVGVVIWKQLRDRIASPAPLDRGLLLSCLPLLLPILFGVVLWQNGAAHALTARHARVFALLPPVMFLALIPRPEAWNGR